MRHTILRDRIRGFRSSGILIHENKILLMRHVYAGSEFYDLPGGGCEAGEQLEDACRREIKEEFNIDVAVGRLIYILDSSRRMNFVFLCDYLSGDIALGGPERERFNQNDQYYVEWVDINKLDQINLMPEETKACLLRFLQNPNQPTFFSTTQKELNKNILIIAPSYYTIPPQCYGGIERIVTLAYLHYLEDGYNVDIVSKAGSRLHTLNLEEIWNADLRKYKFILSYFYKEELLKFLDKQDAQLYIILQNNYKQELSFLKDLSHSKIYVLSRDQREQYERNLRERYDILPNGVDMKQYVITEEERGRDIVYIGALGQHKSPLACLRYAVKYKLHIDFYGPMIFTPEEENYKQEFLQELGNYDKARYLGEVCDDEKKVNILNKYKYFIFLPGVDKDSWVEPFGIAPLEAMACGCTVITHYRVGGHREFCNEHNSVDFESNPVLLPPHSVRNSILDYDFERIFRIYYPK